MKGIGFRLLFILTPILFWGAGVPHLAAAQEDSIGTTNIVSTYEVLDEDISYGDIVSYAKESDTYVLSSERSDKNLFGVVIEKPIILHKRAVGSVPITESGETLINVTTVNGPIYAGDVLTSSSIPGKAQRADETDEFVVGVARESFFGIGTTTIIISDTGEGIPLGQIKAVLSIGPASNLSKLVETAGTDVRFNEATVLNIIQYLVAAFVAVGSVYIAFHNFMPNINEGIISIGRNPRAKSSIQSMVVLNSVLIILVSVAGLALSVAIILLPI